MESREKDKVALLIQDAYLGIARAQRLLGLRYLQGRGVEIDIQQAFYWINLAASADFSLALRSLGELYEQGMGTERNLEEACRLYNAAAIQGDPIAINHLRRLQKY